MSDQTVRARLSLLDRFLKTFGLFLVCVMGLSGCPQLLCDIGLVEQCETYDEGEDSDEDEDEDEDEDKATYAVTYDANGGTGTVPSSSSHEEGDTVTVSDNSGGLSLTGFNWGGWNTTADGNGTTYAGSDTFKMGAANVTLYAKWNDPQVIAVIGGGDNYFALKDSGDLWAWGRNNLYQLGLDDNSQTKSPEKLSESGWASIAAGYTHTLGIKKDGTLWAWGDNRYGQLGDPVLGASASTPSQIGSDSDWEQVSAGGGWINTGTWEYQAHSLAIKNGGELWAWGRNNVCQLGNCHGVNQDSPQRVGSDNDWTQVSAGGVFSVARDTANRLWAWGYNEEGQLGRGTRIGSGYALVTAADFSGPKLSAAQVTIQSPVVGWGSAGQCCGSQDKTVPTVQDRWTDISAHGEHVIALQSDGSIWGWGGNYKGSIGRDTKMNYSILSPDHIEADNNNDGATRDWRSVSVGSSSGHSAAINTSGELFIWGKRDDGRLCENITSGGGLYNRGHGEPYGRQRSPVDAEIWTSVSVGANGTLALRADGTVWACGKDNYGQIGNGDASSDSMWSLTQVSFP